LLRKHAQPTDQEKFYENYPVWIVVVSNLVSLLTYFIGAFIIYQIGLVWLALYLLYILVLEVRLLKKSCINCYYFGKTCAFGKGRLSCLLFRKGDAKKFVDCQLTWKDIVPDFMVSVIPMLAAVGLLVMKFDWLVLALLMALLVLGFAGTAAVRTKLACRFCKQRALGCPAERLFGKNRQQ
jgi:hypothetical protein